MPKKSKKTEPEEEVEVSSDEEVEAPVNIEEDEDDDSKKEKDKAVIRNLRKKAKNVGYRKLANEVGAGAGYNSSNVDMIKYAISKTDVERLAKWSPETGEGVDNEDQLRDRLDLKFSSLPDGALAVLHAHVEGFARNIMADVVTRVFDGASSTVTAAHMRSAVRRLKNVLDFDFEMPQGIVDHARVTEKGVFALDEDGIKQWYPSSTILPGLSEEEQVAAEEKKANVKTINKIIKSKERAFLLKKEEAKKKRDAKISERRAEEAPVSAAV